MRLEHLSSRERADLYATSVITYAAINFRATNVSQIKMRVLRNGEVVEDGILPYIFSRRSGYVNKMVRAETSVCLYGYNAFYKARNAMMMPVGIDWMNPTTYMIDGDNYRGLKGFRVTSNYTSDETGYYVEPYDVVFQNLIDFLDDFDGIAPAEVAFASASAEAELAQTFYAVFRNMAIPAAYVQPAADTKWQTADRQTEPHNILTSLFRSLVQGSRNAGRTIISPFRAEILTLQPPFRDLDTRNISDQVREQVAIAFGIPIELLFASASNYAQFEGVRRTWAHTWLVPHLHWYADAFNEQLASEFGGEFTIEPDFDSVEFLKEDVASRFNIVNAKLQAGLITYGEAQKQLGEAVTPETEHMVYSSALNAPIPPSELAKLYQTLNGALSPEHNVSGDLQDVSTLDESAPVLPRDYPTMADLSTPLGKKSWIPDAQYDELRAWKKVCANKGRNHDFEVMHLRQDVAEFVVRMLADTDDDTDSIFADAKTWLSQKSIQSTRLDFEMEMEGFIEEARAERLTRRRFGTLMRSVIRKYGIRAYRDGLMDGGVEDGAMDTEDYQEAESLIAQQSVYVTDFANTLYDKGISDAQAYGKPEMWFNKSLMPLYQAGLASADRNGLYEWVLGKTEQHCKTCLALNGQRHRMKEYTKRNLVPQASILECKGFNCDCRLVKSTGRAKGRFPSISATKHHHHHDADLFNRDVLPEDTHVAI